MACGNYIALAKVKSKLLALVLKNAISYLIHL